MRDAVEAARLELLKFCNEWSQMRGQDPEMIYGLHMGDGERACAVTVTGLRLVCDALDVGRDSSSAVPGGDLHPDARNAALEEIERLDTKSRLLKSCSDPQCGDSTWDHDCDEKYGTAPGRFAKIARAALDSSSAVPTPHEHEWNIDFAVPVMDVNPPVYSFKCGCGARKQDERGAVPGPALRCENCGQTLAEHTVMWHCYRLGDYTFQSAVPTPAPDAEETK